MNIRNAILAAADHIERNPGEFNYHSIEVPRRAGCGTPGCAYGWIATFSQLDLEDKRHEYGGKQIVALWGFQEKAHFTEPTEFYSRMNEFSNGWRGSASECAAALRLYADKYHPAEPAKPIVYPDWNAMATGYVPGEAVRS